MFNQLHKQRCPESDEGDDSVRLCDSSGCDQEGLHRAPLSPREIHRYRWFCLEHVRQYNRAWNYYRGMTESEVEVDVRRDTVWRRPSWPLGANGSRPVRADKLGDPFGLFGAPGPEPRPIPPSTAQSDAMIILDLRAPVTMATVKARYKELVKRHHPDANGGDKASEEKIKLINEAYASIMDHLAT